MPITKVSGENIKQGTVGGCYKKNSLTLLGQTFRSCVEYIYKRLIVIKDEKILLKI